jgi:3-oxoacyl-(acyl-carrier-protein) synthase
LANRIVITAVGIVSALGTGMDANRHALLHKQHGLRHPEFLNTRHKHEVLIGEVRQSNADMAAVLGLPRDGEGYTRTTLLALTAMQDLLQHTDRQLLQGGDVALINANTVGGMCAVEDMYPEFLSDKTEGGFLKYLDTLDCAESTTHLAMHYGLKPFMATISTACSSSANAMILGARMIRQGLVKRAICGGCDAMSRFTMNGFLSLKNVSKTACKPFDKDRQGLNLGEGAGYVLLEREEDAMARGATILGVLSGWANTNDAYHPTAPSPDGSGAYRTMQQAIQMAGLASTNIGYINAHGTATFNNDVAEGLAIQHMFDGSTPFSSTKPFTGHTLAAAGVIEGIFSLLALQQKSTLPNLNFTGQMEELTIAPITEAVTQPGMNHVLSNSFGFGGSNVSLIFSATS